MINLKAKYSSSLSKAQQPWTHYSPGKLIMPCNLSVQCSAEEFSALHWKIVYCTKQYNAKEYSAVQRSTDFTAVQVECIRVQCTAVLQRTVPTASTTHCRAQEFTSVQCQYSTVHCSKMQMNSVQCNQIQCILSVQYSLNAKGHSVKHGALHYSENFSFTMPCLASKCIRFPNCALHCIGVHHCAGCSNLPTVILNVVGS